MVLKRTEPRRVFWAVCDQAAVSAANFLTIAIGAWMLALPEQSKLVYVYSAYFALVLLNASALFSAAPMLRQEVADAGAYRQQLLRAQGWIAVGGAGVLSAVFAMAGAGLGWIPTLPEMVWMYVFLVLQQLADFNRRADYVFREISGAGLLSILMLVLRVGMLLLVRPENAETFYLLLALSAVPGAIAALARGRGVFRSGDEADVFRRHIRLARWNVMHAPLQWAGLHLPIFLVGALAGGGAAAILASVRSVSTAANVLLELMETYVPSWMASQKEGAGARMATLRLYALGGGLWLAATVAIVVFGEELLALLLGPAYAAYWPMLLLLWVGNGLYFIGRVYGVRYRVAHWTSVELAGSLGGVFTLLACLPLMSWYGALGAAWALVLVQLGSVLSQRVYVRRFVR